MFKPLSHLAANRKSPEELLAGLKQTDNPHASVQAGQKLVSLAKEYGVEMRDFLRLAVDPGKSNEAANYAGLNGYEASLKYLGLPIADDFDTGITLDLASDTFEYSPGTRALFPEVVDDMVRWKYRQTNFENTASLVASSRTIAGVEMISTVVNDSADDYKVMRRVAELAPMPISSIRTSDNKVKMYKIGGGYRTSYEFSRRARLDLLTPYAARMNRELEMSKVGEATSVLINGDGVHPAAGVVTQSSFNGRNGVTNATNGRLSYEHLLQWLVARAKSGAPVDTVVGGWDAYVDWLFLFARPIQGSSRTDLTAAENLARSGFRVGGVPLLDGTVNFALSSTAADKQLLGMAKDETLEELIEAGSLISESERSITTQSVTYTKSEVSGYRLVFGDTREVFDYAS